MRRSDWKLLVSTSATIRPDGVHRRNSVILGAAKNLACLTRWPRSFAALRMTAARPSPTAERSPIAEFAVPERRKARVRSRSLLPWLAVIAVCLALGAWACGGKPAGEQPQPQAGENSAGAGGEQPAGNPRTSPSPQPSPKKPARKKPASPEPPPPLTMPKVALTESLRAACLVQVGDALPDAKLADLDGKEQAVSSLFGRKLTVVCFWNAGKVRHSKKPGAKLHDAATEMLQDLAREIAQPLGDKGARAIAINVGDSVEIVRQHAAAAGAASPICSTRRANCWQRWSRTDECHGYFCSTIAAGFCGSTWSIPGARGKSCCKLSR